MSGRDIDEEHRASTPLELLFDLTFVVAVSRAAAEWGHSVAADDVGQGLLSYLTVFFAIWWAWVNFTWFASAYDTDDIGYRLLTMVQMAGVLVLAAGVGSAFEHRDYLTVTVGYLIMRMALLAQWLRAAVADVAHRRTAQRYAAGVAVVQVGWVSRLLLPDSLGLASFLVLVAAELAVPVWAERHAMTTWHPQHIAERYGLFTIIVLGECVLAASTAIETGNDEHTHLAEFVVLGVGALVLLFGLWWLYYLDDPAEDLRAAGGGSAPFRWGYGHYGVFVALAAIGAGIEVAAEATAHDVEAGHLLISYAVAVPVSSYLLVLWFLRRSLTTRPCPSLVQVLVTIAATLAVAGLGRTVGVPWAVAALCLPTTGLVAVSLYGQFRTGSRRPVEPAPG